MLRGSAAAVAVQALYTITRFLITPFVLANVGYGAFGFWAMLFLALGLVGFHRMGLVGSSVTFVARALAEGTEKKVNAILRTTATIASLLVLVVGVPLLLTAPWIARLLGVDDSFAAEAVLTIRITVAAVSIALIWSGWESALEGLQAYGRIKLVEAAATLLEAGLIVSLVGLGVGLPALAWAFAARLVLPLPCYAFLARRRIRGLQVRPGKVDPQMAGELLRFGGAVQGLGVVHLGIAALDRLVLAHTVSLAAAGAYEVLRKIVNYATSLPAQALAPIIPASAEVGANDPKRLTHMVRGSTRLLTIVCALPLALVGVAPGTALAVWLGPDNPVTTGPLPFLCLAAFVHLATGPTTAVLRGQARAKPELGYALAWIAMALIAVPLGAHYAGVWGVVLASSGVQAAASLGLLWVVWPGLGIPRTALLRDIFAPGLCVLAPALIGSWVLGTRAPQGGRMEALWSLASLGMPVLLCALAGAWSLVLAPPSRRAIARALSRRRLPLCGPARHAKRT